jgi:hypothetical protein
MRRIGVMVIGGSSTFSMDTGGSELFKSRENEPTSQKVMIGRTFWKETVELLQPSDYSKKL